MTCDPTTIAQDAKCLCFDAATWRSVMVYLACQWAKKKEPVGSTVLWIPKAEILSWVDGSGTHSGDWFSYQAASPSPTRILVGTAQITSLTIDGVDSLLGTHLVDYGVDVNSCGSLIDLIVTNCDNLVNIGANGNQIAAGDVSNCPSLLSLDLGNNQLGAVNITGDFAIMELDISNNPGVTIIGP